MKQEMLKNIRKIKGLAGIRMYYVKTNYEKIFLEHFKNKNTYLTQWSKKLGDMKFDKIGEPLESDHPIYLMDNDFFEPLKQYILSQFPELKSQDINLFFTQIFEWVKKDDVKKILTLDNSLDIQEEQFKLIYPTNHLNSFDELLKATGLIGDEYKRIMKPLWYSLVSVTIADKQLKLGSIIVDGRIHILVFLPSGFGKTEIKNITKRVVKGLGKEYIEPTSFHPEQFVGKVRIENVDGKKIYEPIPGHLSLDYLLIDEGKGLITSKESNFAESRRYLRLALDQYPNNTLTKKSVDIKQENALSYEPHCCTCIFLQPFHIDEEIVLDGDLRRFIVSYILMTGINKTESYKDRIRNPRNYETSITKFTNFLKSIQILDEFELTNEATNIFEELSILLIERGSYWSSKIKNFVNIADYTLQNMLLKFSAIQATQNNTNIIDPRHVEIAFVDYAEMLEHTYEFIETKILGSMDYGENWSGAIKKDQDILKWLHEQGATSYDTSNISINEYKEKIKEIYHVQDKQAQRNKKQHEENGWIESKKGQHDSKVWLKIQPKDGTSTMINKVRVDKDFREKYIEIVDKYDLNEF
jgi:hypothetical protein